MPMSLFYKTNTARLYPAVEQSKFLALPFDEIFAFYGVAVEHNVSERRYPVTEIYATRGVTERKVLIDMTVAEDEAIDCRMRLEVLAREYHAVLLFGSKEGGITLHLMLQHAMSCPTMTHPYAPARMYHGEHPLQKAIVEH